MKTSRFSEERELKDKKRFERNAKEAKANPMVETDNDGTDLIIEILASEVKRGERKVHFIFTVIIVAAIALTIGIFVRTFEMGNGNFIESLARGILSVVIGVVIPLVVMFMASTLG